MVFMKHNGDLAIALAQHHADMPPDQSTQALFRIGDAAHGIDHAFLRDVHGMVHQIKQDFVFALEMVVEPALAQLERCRHVVH